MDIRMPALVVPINIQSDRSPLYMYRYSKPKKRTNMPAVSGWYIIALEATWRCCATESARRWRASTLSSSVSAGFVVNSGIESSGFRATTAVSSVFSSLCASGEGEGGGRPPEEVIVVGRRTSGVVGRDGGLKSGSRTRLARKVLKNAAEVLKPGMRSPTAS